MTLRNVANQWITTPGRCIEYLDVATKRVLQSEKQAKESCLPCSIGTDNRDELAPIDVETGLSPDGIVRVASRYVSSCDNF